MRRHKCQRFSQIFAARQLFVSLCFLFFNFIVISTSYAQLRKLDYERSPASFSPDDDVIVAPVIVREKYIDTLVKDKDGNLKPLVLQMKYTMDLWQQQYEFINNWSLQDTGYTLPDQAQKRDFFKKQFFRYLTKEGTEPYKRDLKNWWEQSTSAQSEVDAVTNDDLFDTLSNGKKQPNKEINISKSRRYKLKFRAYLHKARFELINPYMDSQIQAGFNGRTELKLSKSYKTGTSAIYNYRIDNGVSLVVLSQELTDHISVRVSNSHEPEAETTELRNNGTIEFLYYRTF